MGTMEQHLANATSSTTLLHQLRDLWKSPRGTVLHIEALALVAIALSFFLAAFGSCRRWSNRWILQKGFLAANSLSLSLGAYSIGLMQSSPVKSEMHPFWSVFLLTLFGCVDPVTSFSLDYKSQLWKMLYQISLYCGYVLLISISAMSSKIGNVAIGVLSTITFIKAFHRSLAFVQPIGMHNITRWTETHMRYIYGRIDDSSMKKDVDYRTEDLHGYHYVFTWYRHKDTKHTSEEYRVEVIKHVAFRKDLRDITIDEIFQCDNPNVRSCRDVCLSYSMSSLLQRRFFGLECAESDYQMTHDFVFKGLLHKTDDDGILHYKRAFKVIEVELAFLYDTFFTGNTFLRYAQAEATSIWAFASVIGICFVGVVALSPSMRSNSHNYGHTIVVNTTTADLAITVVILVFLVLLQVFQLIRCWTSNWARVSFVTCYMSDEKNGRTKRISPWMGLKAQLTRIKCFDNYLWQNKLGQYSFVDSVSRLNCNLFRPSRFRGYLCVMFGFPYMAKVLRDMFGSERGHAIELHTDVKEAVAEFLYKNNGRTRSAGSATFLEENGLSSTEIPNIPGCRDLFTSFDNIEKILIWHIGTCYCELAQSKKGFCIFFRKGNEDFPNEEERKYYGVATALSKYYAYLLVSAPQLVHKDFKDAKSRCRNLVRVARQYLGRAGNKLELMRQVYIPNPEELDYEETDDIFKAGVQVGQQLEDKPRRWKILADFWVEALLHAAPSDDNAEEHMRHLSQGGEFITHLWALLSHAGILKRQPEEEPEPEPEPEQLGGDASV